MTIKDHTRMNSAVLVVCQKWFAKKVSFLKHEINTLAKCLLFNVSDNDCAVIAC